MKYGLQDIILAILFAVIGTALVVSGLGYVKTSLSLENQPLMVTCGLMFFFAGALVFYRSISGLAARRLPTKPWVEYFLFLPVMLGFGFIFFWAGIVSGSLFIIFLGLVTTAVMIWIGVSRWPGKRNHNDRA